MYHLHHHYYHLQGNQIVEMGNFERGYHSRYRHPGHLPNCQLRKINGLGVISKETVFAKSLDRFLALRRRLNAKGANEANLREKIKISRFAPFWRYLR